MESRVSVNGQYGNIVGDKKVWACAGYARVSTETESQSTSLEEQMRYLENKIKSDSDKTFAGIYADRGSGRSTNERPEFLRMMEDARAGKFDMILCKSVSRFGRNLADFTEHIRELRSLGIRVCFEKESLDSSNPRMEFLLNIFEILAQEESNSQSENLRWGYEKRLMQGIPSAHIALYGYRREGNDWFVVEKKAERVRTVYAMFLNGKRICEITHAMLRRSDQDSDEIWNYNKVMRILRNQDYTGDYVAFQYIRIKDPNTGEMKYLINDGQRPKFIIQDHHEAIISRDDFWKVQKKLGRLGIKKPIEQKKLDQDEKK